MDYFAHVIRMITPTGGFHGDIVKVQAESGVAAVDRIVSKLRVAPTQVYLISEEEAQVWAGLGVPIKEIV
jgi:hypothetical protein